MHIRDCALAVGQKMERVFRIGGSSSNEDIPQGMDAAVRKPILGRMVGGVLGMIGVSVFDLLGESRTGELSFAGGDCRR